MGKGEWASALPYIPTFNAAATPSQMVTAAEANGIGAPDLDRPFSYLDLGCGRGVTALTIAAAYPHARALGLDVDRRQIGRARDSAARAGLTNASFAAAGFDAPPPEWRRVDFVSAYGVYSWLDDAALDRMLAFAAAALRPGGLLALSYNTPVRNAQAATIRYFFARFAARRSGSPEGRIAGALDEVERLARTAPPFLDRNPALRETLAEWREAHPAYLAHEALNAAWRLEYPSEVAGRLSRFGFAFAGDRDAALIEEAETFAEGDALLREDVGALLADRPFRTDVFVRGAVPPDPSPVIPDGACFTLAWPAQSSAMKRAALTPGPVGEMVAACAVAPRTWSALRGLPGVRRLSPGRAGACLRRAMAMQAIVRQADAPPPGPEGTAGFASRFSVEVTSEPDLLGFGLALPSAALGGGVQAPPVIAQLVAAAADGLDPSQWAPRAARRLAPTLQPGEISDDLLRICLEAVPRIHSIWLPFLRNARVLNE